MPDPATGRVAVACSLGDEVVILGDLSYFVAHGDEIGDECDDDLDNDTLAELACSDGLLPKSNGSAWYCSAEEGDISGDISRRWDISRREGRSPELL